VAEQAASAQNSKVARKSISIATPCALGLLSASHTATTLRLTRGTRRALARGRDVRVTVRIAFPPKGDKKAKIIKKSLTIHGRR
jgi:hypothetical protein